MATLAASSIAAGPAAAVDGPQATAFLSEQRQANGIPPLTHSPERSDGCDKHNNYMTFNGLKHDEEPGDPGYTPEGDNVMGSEVLAGGEGGWSATTTPWDTAPIHLLLMFDPTSDVGGGAQSHGFSCYRLGFGTFFSSPTFFSRPGNGARGVPVSMTAAEAPYAPHELVGIAQGATTGHQLLAFAEGVGGEATADATLTGPSGPVDIRVVDTRTPASDGGPWFDTRAVIIPVQPLAAFTTYTATITWTFGASETATQTFSFETTGLANTVSLTIEGQGATRTFRVASSAPNRSLGLDGPGGTKLQPALDGSGAATVRGLKLGSWQACAASGGADSGYAPAVDCKAFSVVASKACVKATRKLAKAKKRLKKLKAKAAKAKSIKKQKKKVKKAKRAKRKACR